MSRNIYCVRFVAPGTIGTLMSVHESAEEAQRHRSTLIERHVGTCTGKVTTRGNTDRTEIIEVVEHQQPGGWFFSGSTTVEERILGTYDVLPMNVSDSVCLPASGGSVVSRALIGALASGDDPRICPALMAELKRVLAIRGEKL